MVGTAVVGDVSAQQALGLAVVLGAGAVVDGVGGPAVPTEECDLVLLLDACAGGLGEVLGWDPCSGAGCGGALVGGVEELSGGPGACGAAADAQGVEQGAVVLAEEGVGPQDACGGVGAHVVGVGPVPGAEEGDQEGPRWSSFSGQEAIEGVGASGDGEREAVGDPVSADLAGAVERVCELGQVGHWPVPFMETAGLSCLSSSGSGLGGAGSRGPGGGGTPSGLGGRGSGWSLSHPLPVSVAGGADIGMCQVVVD